jgi:hypothetical protein
MNKKNNFNFNIDKDDNNSNDFIQCWSEMGFRPSKSVIYKNYDSNFIKYFQDKFLETSLNEDIIPLEDDRMVNQRFFVKIENSIWVTFNYLDSESDEGFVGDVCFYYEYKEHQRVRTIIDELDEFEIKEDTKTEISSNQISRIVYDQTGLNLEQIQKSNFNFKDIDYFYNDDTIKQVNKLSKKIKKSNQGLSIIYGEKGVGKTSIVEFLSEKVKNKQFIYLPTNLFENTINNPEFKNFLKKFKNPVLVLDDAELFFSETFYVKSNIFTTNLLQLVDGFDSHELGINLVLILNCEKETDIDSYLLSSNNILEVIEIGELSKTKANQLQKHLGRKGKIKSVTKLNDIVKDKNFTTHEIELGFE